MVAVRAVKVPDIDARKVRIAEQRNPEAAFLVVLDGILQLPISHLYIFFHVPQCHGFVAVVLVHVRKALK